jgi:hypothetical protein
MMERGRCGEGPVAITLLILELLLLLECVCTTPAVDSSSICSDPWNLIWLIVVVTGDNGKA